MIPARIPDDEDQRVAALHRYQLLDTASEPVFDNITDLAAAICNASHALITLVDSQRQWFKSCRGLAGLTETQRDVSFCAHTILTDEIMEIPNAIEDPRFADNPLVVGHPYIRFYAGHPLRTPEGHGLGSICVIDQVPGRLAESQRRALAQLGHVVSSLFESRRQTREALDAAESARDAANRANTAKSRFLAAMSHEIRTPMNAVLGAAELLQHTQLDGEQTRYVDQVQHSGNHLLALIDDILDLSKLDAKRVSLAERAFDLAAEIERALDMVRPRAREKVLALATRVANDLAPAYRGDADRLRQVLINLLTNAVKFTQEGSVTVRAYRGGAMPEAAASDAAPQPAETVVIEVADTGPGIEPATQANLFQDFVQGQEGFQQSGGGTGLGLAISRRLVEMMGGQIGVDSTPGAGSTFWLALPMVPTVADEVAQPAAQASAGDEVAPLNLLLAEDNPANQMVLEAQLKKDGHRVTMVADGEAAVQAVAAAQQPFDLALLDLRMPGKDGFQALAEIRQLGVDRSRLPAIALTAQAMAGDREAVLAGGFDDYMAKPLSRQHFRKLLQNWNLGAQHTPADGGEPAPGRAGPASASDSAAASAASPEAPDLETEQFEELRTTLGTEALANFLSRMAADGETRRQNIAQALGRGDTEQVSAEAHQLKGMGRNLGIATLRDQGARLEQAAQAGDRDTLARELAALPATLAGCSALAERLAAGEV